MTQEQFKRAVEINNRLNGLTKAKRELFEYYRLNYTDNRGVLDFSEIKDILERHDKMIRKEIDEEIKLLKEEILRL